MNKSQTHSCLARPNLVNRHFIIIMTTALYVLENLNTLFQFKQDAYVQRALDNFYNFLQLKLFLFGFQTKQETQFVQKCTSYSYLFYFKLQSTILIHVLEKELCDLKARLAHIKLFSTTNLSFHCGFLQDCKMGSYDF